MNAPRHRGRFRAIRNAVQQDRKLIAAEARDNVRVTNAALQPPGHGNQQLITNRMTQTVIDVFKTIEVKKEYSKLIVLLVFGALNHEFQVLSQQHPVRQVGERVMEGGVSKVILALL